MADNITRVTRLGFVNAFLVREDDGLTLVDTMLPRSSKPILGAAERLGAPIVRIALTHAHGDHVGSLDELAAALPGVEVLISTRDARLLAKDMSLDPGEPNDKLRGGYPGAKTAPTRPLEPGDMVGSLEVVASPGHTPGHVAYLDRRDQALVCGDAYATKGGTSVPSRNHLRFPLVYLATWDPGRTLASARALRGLDPTVLAPGHGPGLAAPGAEMDRAIAR